MEATVACWKHGMLQIQASCTNISSSWLVGYSLWGRRARPNDAQSLADAKLAEHSPTPTKRKRTDSTVHTNALSAFHVELQLAVSTLPFGRCSGKVAKWQNDLCQPEAPRPHACAPPVGPPKGAGRTSEKRPKNFGVSTEDFMTLPRQRGAGPGPGRRGPPALRAVHVSFPFKLEKCVDLEYP